MAVPLRPALRLQWRKQARSIRVARPRRLVFEASEIRVDPFPTLHLIIRDIYNESSTLVDLTALMSAHHSSGLGTFQCCLDCEDLI